MTIKEPIIFVSGVAIGGAVAWFVCRKHYKRIAEEEITSVKESFDKLQKEAQRRADAAKSKPDLSIYVEALEKAKEREEQNENSMDKSEMNRVPANTHVVDYSGFTDEDESDDETSENATDDEQDYYAAGSTAQPVDKRPDHSKPYLLNRMPYPNERPYHSLITVMYYADGTYADTHGTEMEIEDYIGTEMMNRIETSDEDELFIRNDALQLDIDIVKDSRTYDEIMFG